MTYGVEWVDIKDQEIQRLNAENAARQAEIDRLRALLTEAREMLAWAGDWVDINQTDTWEHMNRIWALFSTVDALDGGSGSVAHQEWESGVAWERHADALDGGSGVSS